MLAEKISALEGAQDCLMVGSGAAAITDAVVSQVKCGRSHRFGQRSI